MEIETYLMGLIIFVVLVIGFFIGALVIQDSVADDLCLLASDGELNEFVDWGDEKNHDDIVCKYRSKKSNNKETIYYK